jgi:hypothetical protein
MTAHGTDHAGHRGAEPLDPEALIAEMTREFPRFRITRKKGSRLSRCIDVTLRLVTLGSQSDYMTRYHTVLGYTLYVPELWDTLTGPERVVLLRHERVHLRQRRRLGMALMAFLYLIPFFPLGLAYGRARLEWEAYAETLRATAEVFGTAAARSPVLRREIVRRFTGGAYGWMWPFPRQVGRWYDATLAGLERNGKS